MSTPIANFREPIRCLIGDNDPDIQFRENAQIDAAIRTVVDMGKVVGDQTTVDRYSVTSSRDAITPDLSAADDPKAFAQLVLHAAKLFVCDSATSSWRTRAFSESVGANYEQVWIIMEEIRNVEFGQGLVSSAYPE